MFQKRSLTTGFLVASLGIAAGLGVFASPNLAGAVTPCSDAVKDDAVKAHCTKGGQEDLKKAMKEAVDAANKAEEKGPDGKKLECKTCHEDLTKFKLNSKGEELYGKHLKKYFK